jgi:hypothetical protein
MPQTKGKIVTGLEIGMEKCAGRSSPRNKVRALVVRVDD